MKVAKCGNTACSANTIISTAGGIGQYDTISLAVGAEGYPVLSHYETSQYDLVVIKCGNASCSSGNITTMVITEWYAGTQSSIAIGSDTLPVISYYDIGNRDLKVVKCGNSSCSSGNIITAVDTGGDVGQSTSIAVRPDGRPVISYQGQIGLKVAKENP